MADGDELSAALELADEARRSLRALAPNHELLRFDVDCISDNPELHTEFRDRFWNQDRPWRSEPGSRVNTYCYGCYLIAVNQAIEALK